MPPVWQSELSNSRAAARRRVWSDQETCATASSLLKQQPMSPNGTHVCYSAAFGDEADISPRRTTVIYRAYMTPSACKLFPQHEAPALFTANSNLSMGGRGRTVGAHGDTRQVHLGAYPPVGGSRFFSISASTTFLARAMTASRSFFS